MSVSYRYENTGDANALRDGMRLRRKRLFTACVATFLTPLMAVDPATLDAGIAAGALAA